MTSNLMWYEIQLPPMLLEVSGDTCASNYKERIRLRVIEHLQSLDVEEASFRSSIQGLT